MTHYIADIDGHEPGLRERKKRATSQALQLAALKLVHDRGLAHVTIEDIAAAADVSPRTFFNYFSSKEEALVGSDPHHAEWFADALRSRPEGVRLLDSVRYAFGRAAAAIAEETDLHLLRMQVVRANPELFRTMIGSFGGWERSMATAIAERIGVGNDEHIFPALAASVVAAVMRSAMRSWSIGGAERTGDSLARLFDDAFAIVASGLDETTIDIAP